MAPYRGPVFSQGRAWLPPWLTSSSFQSDAVACDTPSMFAASWKDFEESTLNGDTKATQPSVFNDVTNRGYPRLHLSEEVSTEPLLYQCMEDHKLENKFGADRPIFSQPKALVLQLSLSQTETAADSNLKCKTILELELEGETTLECTTQQDLCATMVGSTSVLEHQFQEGSQIVKNGVSLDRAPSIDKAVVAGRLSVSPTASQCTQSTELYVPPAQQSSQCRGKLRTSADQNAQSHEKRPAENPPSKVRNSKKVKVSNTKAVNEDIQAAIGLTVATAETLVIADIMNGCLMCQDWGPKAILDAALTLKRGREMCGLDDFTLEDLSCKVSSDPNGDEGLDDIILEEEYLCALPMDVRKEVPCGFTPTNSDMQTKESSSKTEIVVAMTMEMVHIKAGAITASNPHQNSSAEQHQDQSQDKFSDAMGLQEIIDTLPILVDNPDKSSTSHQCSQAHQHMAPMDSFNSRWLGGWTGINREAEEQVRQNLGWAGKKHENHMEFETSELSEPCDLAPPVENLRRCLSKSQHKGSLCAITSMPQIQNEPYRGETLTPGSCAEILMALSQASVKCSLQEPLCSFVPCSVNAKLISPSTELGRNSDHEVNTDCIGGKGTSMAYATDTTVVLKSATNLSAVVVNDLKFTLNGQILGRSSDKQQVTDEQHIVPEVFLPGGVKRIHSNSLKGYSTSPFSPLLEAVMLTTEKQHCVQNISNEKRLPSLNGKQVDSTGEADKSTIVAAKSSSSGQSEFILQDSGLQDSPPLTWHRGKKRRLRACRIVESALTEDTCADTICGFLSDHGPASVKILPKAGNVSGEDWTGFGKATLLPEDGITLHTLGNSNTDKLKANPLPGAQKESDWEMRGCGHIGKLDKADTKGKVYKRRGRSGTSSHLFKGLHFLVTGFPANQKTLCEEVSRKIQVHGGVLLSSVPTFSSLDNQKTHEKQQTITQHSIIVAPQKVRTLKYLYGCAVGSLIVRPNWVDECITMNALPFVNKFREKGSNKNHHDFLYHDKDGSKERIFSRIEAFVHGQRGYCTKLSLLIQHGGGKLLRSLKSSVQVKNAKRVLIQIVVAEHQSKLPQILKETAASFGLPIVLGDWIIGSLLDGRLLALPAPANPCADIKASNFSKVGTGKKVRKEILSTNRRHGIRRAGSPDKTENITSMSESEENVNDLCVSFLAKCATSPALSTMGFPFELAMPKVSTSTKLSSGFLYYKAVCINGIIYSAGDVVEILPQTEEEKEPYVAQIESFYAGHSSIVTTRSARTGAKRQPKKPCYLCCRWFYRPSDTGFPCVATGKELYLSKHFDDKVPVQSIMKRVKVVLVVGGKLLTNDNELGWKIPTQGSLCTVEAADYVCRFFYDYQKESLHQLKSALTS